MSRRKKLKNCKHRAIIPDGWTFKNDKDGHMYYRELKIDGLHHYHSVMLTDFGWNYIASTDEMIVKSGFDWDLESALGKFWEFEKVS